VIFQLLALLAAQAGAEVSAGEQAAYKQCVDLVQSKPEQAVEAANAWRLRGGGLFARECVGLAYVALERWQPAAVAFEQAAREAELGKDVRSADLWVQSGNSWLAADDGAKARAAFDAALAAGTLAPELRGEVHLDRGRANVALGDLAAARADFDRGLELVPGDAFGWYLSAALAMRQEALDRAKKDVAKAVELAPDDADVLLLAGNISGTLGDLAAARSFYGRAADAAPDSAAGRAAQAALAANSGEEPTTPLPADLDDQVTYKDE
jgi:tetratricopeptide (TPR) repeat protein